MNERIILMASMRAKVFNNLISLGPPVALKIRVLKDAEDGFCMICKICSKYVNKKYNAYFKEKNNLPKFGNLPSP